MWSGDLPICLTPSSLCWDDFSIHSPITQIARRWMILLDTADIPYTDCSLFFYIPTLVICQLCRTNFISYYSDHTESIPKHAKKPSLCQMFVLSIMNLLIPISTSYGRLTNNTGQGTDSIKAGNTGGRSTLF